MSYCKWYLRVVSQHKWFQLEFFDHFHRAPQYWRNPIASVLLVIVYVVNSNWPLIHQCKYSHALKRSHRRQTEHFWYHSCSWILLLSLCMIAFKELLSVGYFCHNKTFSWIFLIFSCSYLRMLFPQMQLRNHLWFLDKPPHHYCKSSMHSKYKWA